MPISRFVPEPDLARLAAHTSEAREELDRQQSRIAQAARSNLAGHRQSGQHQIVTSTGAIDRYVQLEGEAALSVEAGHFTRGGTHVAGTHVLRDAI